MLKKRKKVAATSFVWLYDMSHTPVQWQREKTTLATDNEEYLSNLCAGNSGHRLRDSVRCAIVGDA